MKAHAINWMVAALLLAGSQRALSQGFVNLDFEAPILPLVPDSGGFVPIWSALPGWRGYIGGSLVGIVRYNTTNTDTAHPVVGISFHGPGSFLTPCQGNYFIFLEAGPGPNVGINFAAIAQTGQIPVSAQSLRFFADNLNVQVSFAGQNLNVFNLSGGIYGYQEYGADVSLLAGQTGELRFTGLGSGSLDYIHFGAAIPEPSTLSLVGLGLLGLLWGGRRKRSG